MNIFPQQQSVRQCVLLDDTERLDMRGVENGACPLPRNRATRLILLLQLDAERGLTKSGTTSTGFPTPPPMMADASGCLCRRAAISVRRCAPCALLASNDLTGPYMRPNDA